MSIWPLSFLGQGCPVDGGGRSLQGIRRHSEDRSGQTDFRSGPGATFKQDGWKHERAILGAIGGGERGHTHTGVGSFISQLSHCRGFGPRQSSQPSVPRDL